MKKSWLAVNQAILDTEIRESSGALEITVLRRTDPFGGKTTRVRCIFFDLFLNVVCFVHQHLDNCFFRPRPRLNQAANLMKRRLKIRGRSTLQEDVSALV